MDVDNQDPSSNNQASNTNHSSTTPHQTRDKSPLHPRNNTAGMSTMVASPVRNERRRYEEDVPHPVRSRPAPPLQPYVTDEKRVHPPRISGWSSVPDPGLARYHATPDNNRPPPPPIHNPPTGNNWQRQLERGPEPPQMRSSAYHSPSCAHTSHHPHPYHPPGDNSPRSVTASGSGSRVQLPPFGTLPGAAAMQRSRSSRSQQSIPMTRNPSQNSSNHSHRSSGTSSMVDGIDENSGEWPSVAPPMFDSKRRTRALMTKSQMAALKTLWRDTKFPGNEEREALGRKIGLTPRQVQVWFQNQRQKIRKEINESKVPAGANPQDYNDLDKSPRSRKLTLEASGSVDRAAVHSASSSDRSGSSFRHHVSGLGLQTPRDDDSRSIATGSSTSAPYPTTADSLHHQGQPGFWDQSRNHSAQSPSEPHPFAFHKPPTPGLQPRPPPYPSNQDRPPSSSYLDPRPNTHLHYAHGNYPRPSFPPPPMRHAATDGEVLLRRRSNSLENLNRGAGSEMHGHRPSSNYAQSTHPPPIRPRTQIGNSELPPSLAALMVAGPMHEPQNGMQRFPSDHGHGHTGEGGQPTLPPPRGWTPERPNGLERGHTDPTRGGSSSSGSRLPGYQSMFGRGHGPNDARR